MWCRVQYSLVLQKDNIKSVVVENGVTSVGDYAFTYCQNLASVSLGNTVAKIGDQAFSESGLVSIAIPASVTEIGEVAFGGCTKLTEIGVAADNTKYSSASGVLFNKDQSKLIVYPVCKTDTTYEVPATVISIEQGAFYGAKNLRCVDISDSPCAIGEYAFILCENLESVTLGSGVTEIGTCAFAYCEKLESIRIPSTVPVVDNEVLESSELTVNKRLFLSTQILLMLSLRTPMN